MRQSTINLDALESNNYLTIEDIGSTIIRSCYPADARFCEVASNGQSGDYDVTLYTEVVSGTYFVTTNAGPILSEDLRSMGYATLDEVAEWVRTGTVTP